MPANAPTPRILTVDDEPHVRQFLRLSLQAEGFEVLEAVNADEALTLVHAEAPDLMILDLGLPDLDGQQVIRDVRLKSALPILVLSGRTEDAEKIAALEHGADDYLNKPFSMQDLVYRVRAALEQHGARRARLDSSSVQTGELQIRLDQREVKRGKTAVSLDEEEYAVLRLLALHGGQVMTAGRLARALWGRQGDAVLDRVLQSHITALRRKLESEPSFPRYILTEAAVGYRLEILPPKSAA
jgi:two-component system, OmpR family, KDP operon response regulator KdpE